jgi:hypothetical protein
MNRRASIQIKEIVFTDPIAKEHYERMRVSKENVAIPVVPENAFDGTTAVFKEAGCEFEYNPLLLAESLALIEEVDEEDEEKLPRAVQMDLSQKRRQSVAMAVESIAAATHADPIKERKASAIDEHNRIVSILEGMGILVL